MIIKPAVFAPDQPPLTPGVTNVALNVYPRTANSYGPLRSLQAVGASALAARCQGAVSVQDKLSTANIFAGDATKLYRYVASAFADVSKVGGYTTTSREHWNFELYGERVIATNYADAIQSFVMGSSSVFADLITTGVTSLKARYVAAIKEWIFYQNTNDATDGIRPQRVWWGAVDDPTTVPTPGTATAREKQSDFQDVLGQHGAGRGIVGGLANADGLAFFERAVYRIDYVGPPVIFTVLPINGARGTPAPKSIVKVGSVVMYLSENGFSKCDGAQATPLGSGVVDEFFFGDVNLDALHLVSGAVDPVRPLAYWAYPRSGVSYCNRMLVFNWELGRWAVTDIDSVQAQLLVQGITLGVSLDNMTGLIDSYSQPVDDRQFVGGRLILAAFDTSNRLAYFSGPTLRAVVETEDAQLVDGYVSHVTGCYPITDGGAPVVQLGTKNNVRDPYVFGSEIAVDHAGFAPVNGAGRYHRARVIVPADAVWSHIRGVDVPKEQVVRTSRR